MASLLNEILIARALVNYHKTSGENIEVKACQFKLSSANGENFCSDIYVAEVKYKLNGNDMEEAFIVKIMIPEIAEVGTNEDSMFTKVLPRMEESLKIEAGDGPGCTNKLFARCLLTERNGPHEFYILENLNTLGYFCADRIKGFDEAHARLVMQKIAKFHAASMMYEKKFPDVVKNLGKAHFANGAADVIAEAITFGGLEYVANMIENWSGYEYLAPKLRNIIVRFNELVKEVVDPQNSAFNVINHGDVWVNNILFKYNKDSQQPIDAVFVDFQNSYWGGCGYDLNYVLFTSLELDVLKTKRETLLKYYYESLSNNLKVNGYPVQEIPSWEHVLSEVKRSDLISLYTSLCELPIIALDKTNCKEFTLQTYQRPKEMAKMRHHMYANERVRENLLYTLKYFEEIGIL